jgi:hypothetical protein
MSYIGYKPADKPLTSADITDSIITSAKIVDGTIVNGDISNSTIALAKLSATGTADSTTFLRGDNTWGSAGATAGQVIQVVQYFSDNAQTSTTSTSYVATTHSVSITPSSTANKILLLASATLYANSQNTYYTIYRDIGGGGYSNLFTDAMCTHSVNDSSWNMASAHYLHSPSTTSAITYKLYFRVGSGTGYIGKNDDILSLIAMEIKG